MQAKTWLLCTAAIGCLFTSSAFGQQTIQWQPTLDVAKRVAGQTNRLVLIHFWSPSCEPCRRMERDVFPRSDVAAAVETGYVAVKLNADHFPATARQYGVSALPTDVVITPQGQLLEKSVGSAGAEKYIALLHQIAAKTRQNTSPDYAQSLAAGPLPQTWPANSSPVPSGYPNYPPSGFQGSPVAGQPVPAAPPYGMQAAIAGVPSANPSAMASANGPYTQPIGGQIAQPPYASQQPGVGSTPAFGGGTSMFTGAPYSYGQPAPPASPALGQQPFAPPMQQNFPPSFIAGSSANRGGPGLPPHVESGVNPSPSPATTAGAVQAGPQGQPLAAEQAMDSPAADFAPQAETRPQVAAGNPPLALDGYCPVQLSEKERWVKGNPRWGLIHQGLTYLFAGPEEQGRFYADPDRYAPVHGGSDIVQAVDQKQEIAGRREHGAWFDGRVYLFSSEESYSRFSSDPHRYLQAMQQMAKAGHKTSGMAATHSGIRY